ncbi:MAG: tRNA-dihydrouridine synthase family protein [Victivallales bacterium]|nr:tRNA-dihydrouridine synthase family protein [Victivallales bacterium]
MPSAPTIATLAPMAGYTDLPFRRVCRRYGLYYGTTALIDAGALVHGNPDNVAILHRGEEEEWLQVQLLGSIPTDIRTSTRILRDGPWHFDALNFNMGCPVRKVVKRLAGAALMNQPVRALECLKEMRDNWPGVLTVKMRILKEDTPEPTIQLAQQLEAIGVQGLAIHGRLARMLYSGPVHTQIIRAVRENVKIPVIANGGIFSLEDAQRLSQETGCERVMVARGTIGVPWIFRDIATGTILPVSQEELLDVMTEHVDQMVQEYGEKGAMILSRKIISSYLGGRGFPHELRAQVVNIATWQDFATLRSKLTICPVQVTDFHG